MAFMRLRKLTLTKTEKEKEMKMKNLLKSLMVGIALVCTSATIPSANAVGTIVHRTIRLLTGTWMCVSNNWSTANGTNFWYYSYSVGSNVLGNTQLTYLTTNTYPSGVSITTTNYGTTYPGALLTNAPVWPDLNADITPNICCQVIMNYTNAGQIFAPPNQSSELFNTGWGTNAIPWILQTNQPAFVASAGTNTVSVTLYAVSSGEFGLPDTSTSPSKSFNFTFTATGQGQVLSTNIPIAFLQGAYGVSAVVSYYATNTAAIFNAINLDGWGP
jgi:hypothetical protein